MFRSFKRKMAVFSLCTSGAILLAFASLFMSVIRRAGIYGPRDYLRIVQEQLRYWKVDALEGLNAAGRKAQEKILGIAERLARIADYIESKSKAKTFNFEVVFNREFAME